MKTYEKIRVLNPQPGSPEFIERSFYYDAKGRVIQQVSTNIKSGTDRTTFTYNWSGNVLTSTETHSYTGGSATLATTATYDRTGKKLTQSVQADNQATATNSYDYDDLNRLKTKKYGDLAENTAYTLQGWVSSINSDKFGQGLVYFPNGNISRVSWQHGDRLPNHYLLNYDGTNRLIEGNSIVNFKEDGFSERDITYDRNGNIKTLVRTSNFAVKDNLVYNYSGNQLVSVTTTAGDLASTYTYDANGNLKTDSRKSLNFDYNYLNLLEKVGETNYTYAADGTKLSVKNGANGFDYLGSLILSANSTEFQFSDGIITKTTGGYDVTYHLRDHLGSVRTVVNKTGDVLQQSDYYPFGLKQERADYVNNSNRFLFNGKESQTTGNLGFLDYGARMYNGELARWFVKDPVSEKYFSYSPYVYTMNNPIRYIDPNGLDVYHYDKKTGEMTLVRETKDNFDQIGEFKKDKKTGKYIVETNKKGKTKGLVINKVEKHILHDKANFKMQDNVIEVGGNNQAPVEGVHDFVRQLSKLSGVEINGYSFSRKGESNESYMYIGRYKDNTERGAETGLRINNVRPDLMNKLDIRTSYHVHPDTVDEYSQRTPSDKDLNFKNNNSEIPKFIILLHGDLPQIEY